MVDTEIRDAEGGPLMRVAPVDAEVCALELPSGSVELGRRQAKTVAFALVEWCGKGRKLRLWGVDDIVRFADVSRPTVDRWRQYRDFPLPCAEVSGVPIWEEPVVRAWVKHRRPRRGRPTKAESKEIQANRTRRKLREGASKRYTRAQPE